MANLVALLDEQTANRIAAGEVVERPASAVKELVENAIDAGATQIEVSLEDGGKRRIQVSDNGIGMSPNDAVLALQRHATSKIRTADDLFDIATLGFRGEALPSIGSVSNLTLTSKDPSEPAGVCVIVRGGSVDRVDELGMRDGTTVTVEDLFYNTPARLKFMKSTPAELARCVEVVGQLAASHPQIAFRLTHGNQPLFSSPGNGDQVSALAAIWGRDIARNLMPIQYDSLGLAVRGYVGSPDIHRSGRSHELFFVNCRPIKSRLLSHALENAMRTFTPEGRFPVAAVFIEIAPNLVDVNVHPTKTEVRFTRDGDVHHAVSAAVKSAIERYGILPTVTDGFVVGVGDPSAAGSAAAVTQASMDDPDVQRVAKAALDLTLPIAAATPVMPSEEALSDAQPVRPFAEQLRGFRVMGQVQNTYIVAATEHGVAFIDQHVAHERVLYERLTTGRLSHGVPVQRLTEPLTITFGAAEAALLRTSLEAFQASGWEIEPFGRDSFLVRAVPAYAPRRGQANLLRDMVDELAHLSVARRLIVQRDHVTITNACKMAVKSGDPLTIEEMKGLLEQLADTENPYMCPHGRPIVVTVPFLEIDRRFKRA